MMVEVEMMSSHSDRSLCLNNFHAVGEVVGNAVEKNGGMTASIVIREGKVTTFLTFVGFNDIADMIQYMCRNKNIVAVSGYMRSYNRKDYLSINHSKMIFIVTDIMIIRKWKPLELKSAPVVNPLQQVINYSIPKRKERKDGKEDDS